MSVVGKALWVMGEPNKIWIVKYGRPVTGYTPNYSGNSSNSSLTQESDCILLHSNKATNSYATCSFTPEITFPISGYNYLVCTYQVRGYYSANRCPAFGVINNIGSGSSYTTFVANRTLLSGGTNTLTTKLTAYLDISGVSGTHRIGFQEAGSGNSNWYGDFYCYALYLSKTSPWGS